MLSEIVGKLSMLSEIVKDVDGGWGVAEDLKCCRPEKFLVCRNNFRFVGKVLPLPPPPQKNIVHAAKASSETSFARLQTSKTHAFDIIYRPT